MVVSSPDLDTTYYSSAVVVLAAEIGSPSTKVQGRVLKRHLYAESGIRFHLLVDCASKPVQAKLYELTDGEYRVIATSEDGRLVLRRPCAAEVNLDG